MRFSNLNSLYGEWNIDFTDPAYQNDGIFAITGPTGSGKTTIMDAVCLALYGQTPRLGKVSQGTCEIMSRKTGECFSEVEFESSKGCFRCHWSQKRSYLKSDGNLQAPRHEISDARTGEILESSRNQVLKRVGDATGMDFEQFTRAIMLAQGGFAAFLEAKPTERAPILEQITGTEIYSRISAKVFEKTKEEKAVNDNICAGIKGADLLGEDEIEALKHEIKDKTEISDDLSEKIREYGRMLLWLDRIKELNCQILRLEEEKSVILADEEKYSDDFIRLEKAQRAAGLEGVFRDYVNIRELAEKSKNEYESAVKDIEELKLRIKDLSEESTHAEEILSEIKTNLSEELEIIKKVFELDLKTEAENKNHMEYKRRHDALSARKKHYEQNISDLKNSFKKTEEQLKWRTEFLRKHQKDSELPEILGVLEEKISLFSDRKEAVINKKVFLENILLEKKQNLLSLEEAKQAFDTGAEKCKEAEIKCRENSLKLSNILGKKTVEEIRSDVEIFRENIQVLRELRRISEKKRQFLDEKNAVMQENTLIISETERTTVLIENLLKEIEAEEKLFDELEEKKLLFLKIKNLEKQRDELVQGEPCPLCGSLSHPYSAGIIKENDENSEEINRQRKKITSLNDLLNQKNAELARLNEGCRRNSVRTADIEREILYADSDMASGLKKAGLDPEDCTGSDFFLETEKELEGELQNLKELLKDAEDKKRILEDSQNYLSSEKEGLYNIEKEYNSIKNSFESLIKDESRFKSEISHDEEKLSKNLESLKAILDNFGEYINSETESADLILILKNLTGRKENYSRNHSEREKFSKALDSLKKDIETAEKELRVTETESSDVLRDLTESKKVLEQYKDKRYCLYADKDPKYEERRLLEQVSEAEQRVERIKGLKNSSEGSLKSKIWQKDSLETEKTRYSTTLVAKEMKFSDELSDAGFSDLKEFTESQLSSEEISSIKSLKDRISERKNRNKAMISDRKESLESERKKALTEKNEEELRKDKESSESENSALLNDIGGIKRKLSDNEARKAGLRENMQKLAAQKEICRRWDELNTLIGSRDGQKFRNFAQGLTFEVMIANANRQLEKMNDRYILIHSPDVPLELSVIDNYQAGEVRSTRNLSGGESFIVSLALALGLSNMAGKNVRVDSLFLDEGFGTLDEESLETALETLSGLRQDGKLIGIISHVSAIRQRIPARLEVVRKSGGRSLIRGPGCTKK